MGETTDKIETFIESKRADLSLNFQELEQKIKSATDWRQQFQKSPMTMMGLALSGGVLLAALVPTRSKRTRADRSLKSNHHEVREDGPMLQAFHNIKSALVGVAATRFTDFVEDFIPGFRQHLQGQEKGRPVNPAHHL